MKSVVAALVALTGTVNAHTIFRQLIVDGTDYGVGNGVRVPSYDGPITDVDSDPIACNGGPNPTTPTDLVIDVQAGSTVSAIWRHTLDTTGDAPDDVMDSSHLGPISAYMKKVSDAASDSGVGDGWFKVQEYGLENGVWGTETVINGKGIHDVTIPQCIESGQYLLRVEMLALHGAGSYPGAQFYQECAQLNVIGGSGSASPSTVSFPGAYKV